MSSTVCTTAESKLGPEHMDYTFSRNSNTAGAPLPLIPRRTSSSRTNHAHAVSPSPTPSAPNVQSAMLLVQPPTPPEAVPRSAPTTPLEFRAALVDSDSSSATTPSDDSRPTIAPRAKRIRGLRIPAVCPPEQSTPTPALFKAKAAVGSASTVIAEAPSQQAATDTMSEDDDTPRPTPQQRLVEANKAGRIRLNLDGIHARNISESSLDAFTANPPASAPIILPASVEDRLVRKKSGEPLKSSLKSMKRPPRGSITVITGNASSSKSEPNTPTHAKFVHFDAKLEHVKLFLAEQKPLAVSRDGSPTDDTSGTDSEFPSFIFGSGSGSDDGRTDLVMQVTNMPATVKKDADVALQELVLSEDKKSIHGRVRVRNIAFEKWLAVRFTFDWWQTTSEVTARYIESQDAAKFDIFAFTIRLQDILSRIEEKTLFLALRYTVGGKEIWDNNGGENYLAKFSKTPKSGLQRRRTPEDSDSGNSDMANLHMKLEKVARGQESKASFLAHNRRASLQSPEGNKPPPLKADTPLSSRYDFAASLRSPWRGGVSPPRHLRTNTHPTSPNTIPWPQKPTPPRKQSRSSPLGGKQRKAPLGSPRDLSDDELPPVMHVSTPDEVPFPVASPTRQRGARNHQRGYFDIPMADASGIKRTPPGTPHMLSPAVDTTPSQRFNSYPPTNGSQGIPSAWSMTREVSQGSSEESTPSITSPSSTSSSSVPSPTEQLTKKTGPPNSPGSDNQYSVFLNRFCFYTGSDSLLDVPADIIPRSHSASTIEEFLSSQSPPLGFQREYSQFSTPTRSSSFDDLGFRSGSSTPKARHLLAASDSRSSTPVAG